MNKRNLIAITAALLFSACIPSVNPFYTSKDIVFDARLLGEWQETDNPNNPQIWKFEKSDDNSYKLTISEKQREDGKFDARLLKLKEQFFLDLILSGRDYATNYPDFVSMSMFPGHMLVCVTQMEPELKLAYFNYDWLQTFLQKNPKALAHHVEDKLGQPDSSIVLTAKTQDLQRFVLAHMADGELFDKPGVLIRKIN